MNCASSGFGLIGRTFPAWVEDAQADAESANPNILHTIGRRWRPILAATLFAFSAWHFGHAAYIHAKARLAQHLIASAWQQTKTLGAAVKPWPWADTWPIARLTAPSHDIELYILADSTGRSLAFGPGHLADSALPGLPGRTIIVGHRDTHFAFMRNLKPGESIRVEGRDGRNYQYVVRASRVIGKRDLSALNEALETGLTLVTCYPFDAVSPNTPLRYVVEADLLPA